MNKIITLAILLLLAISTKSFTQTCGSQASPEFIEQVKQIALQEQVEDAQTANRSTITLGVKFWDLHAPNFTSQFNDAYANSFLGVLDAYFSQVGVNFEKCGSIGSVEDNFLRNFNYSDPFSDQFIYTNYYLESSINIYVVDDLCANLSGISMCGIFGAGEFPWSSRIAKNTLFLKRSELLGGYGDVLLIHEMGHFFGLFHTFGNVPIDNCNIISNENPDGSNCQSAGDLICDTPADPGLRCPDAYVNDLCQFKGNNGFEVYHPLTNNFMSYPPSDPSGLFGERRYCIGGQNGFTQGQITRMLDFVDDRQNLVCQSGGGGGNCADTYEPNDNRNDANTYFGTLGGTPFTTEIQAKIGSASDFDFFKVQFTQIGYLTLDIPVLPKNYNLYIYKGNIQMGYSPNAGTQPEHIFFNVTISDLNTDYYFVIQGATNQDFDCSNTYRFVVNWQPGGSGIPGGSHTGFCNPIEDIAYEPNSTLFTAYFPPQFDLDPNDYDGGDAYGNITSPTDVDYYRVKLNSIGYFAFGCGSANGLDLKFDFIHSSGTPLVTGQDCGLIYFEDDDAPPGVYYFRVYSPSGDYECDPQYRVWVESDPDNNGSGGGNNGPCNPLPDAGAEPSETFAQAFYNPQLQNITQGGHDETMSSWISSATDVDVYRLELNLDGMLRFEYCAPQNLNATFEVFNSSGNIINNVSIGNCNDWSMLLYNAGTYYVKIKAQNGAFNCTEPYTFRFTFTAIPSGGGGNTNPWDCSEAIDLPVNNEVYCGPLAGDYCPVYTFGSNINKPNRTPNYNCSPIGNFGGGEKLYKVTKPFDGYCCTGLVISLNIANGNPNNWTIHLYDNCDLSNCINNSNQIINNNSISFQFNNISTGDYYILIDVQNGQESDYTILANCMREINCPVIVDAINPSSIVIDYSDQNIDCTCGNILNPNILPVNFSCNTSTTLTAEAICTSGFEIQWFNSLSSTITISTGQTLQVTEPGLYFAESVQISTGCKSERVPVLVSPPNIPATMLISDAACGSNNGGIEVEILAPNNVSDYSYNWSNGQTSSTLQNVGSGTYTVTISNADGCSVVRSATVGGANAKVQLFKQEDACIANPNRLIQAFASSNNPIIQYEWNTGDTTTSITSTDFGSYSITVTDSEGCTATNSIQVENKSFSTLPHITKPSCKGMTDGEIALSVFHGVPPMLYQWSNGANNSELTNLAKGDYIYTVTDARGCQIVDTLTIEEPDSIIFHVAKTSPTCSDSLNGSIAVFVEGGTRFFEYQWNNGFSDNVLNQVDGGVYALTVTDWNNCVSSATINLTKPDALEVDALVSSVPCAGLPTGSISIQTSGGVLPYSFAWQNGDTISALTNLLAGIYEATITDANGCYKTINAIIDEPAGMGLQTTTVNVSCSGGNNGNIAVTPNGGTTPYNINFNSGNGTGLTAGQYIITVTDANNCPVYDTVTITEPTLLICALNKTDVSCAGLANGSATATTMGGTLPYSFDWLGSNSVTNTVSDLLAGVVTLYVTDGNNCKNTVFVTITEPTPIGLNFSTEDESCLGKSDGSAVIGINGGITPYQINWNNGSNATELTNISAGNYQVTITDANSCTKTETVIVGSLPPLSFSISPIPTTCSYTDDGALQIDIIVGVAPFSINIDNSSATPAQYFSDVLPGQHQVFITDANNCIWAKDFEIVQPLPIDATLSVSKDSILMGEVVELSVSSDNYNLAEILWTPSDMVDCANCSDVTTQPFYNQKYSVAVKNDAGCVQELEQFIKVSRERPIYVPNAFSPNGDGNNDHFTIFGGANTVQIKYLRVFDRWGNLLFEKTNFPPNEPEMGWNGLFKGEQLDTGVYIYIAEIEFVDKQVLKYSGDVSILR